jgi:hypothetical protein
LQGKWRDGSTLLNEGIGYDNGIPTNFAFSGDPLTGEGWSEINANNPNGDRRAIISSAPFTYLSGAVNEFIIGFTYNDAPNASHLEKISGLRANVDLIQSLFDGCFELNESTSEIFGCSPLITNLNEIVSANSQLTIYPNPASNFLQIEVTGTGIGILQVYSPSGQLLLEKEVGNGSHELDVTNWPKGVYFLQWKNRQGIVTEKLMVQ